LSFNNGQVILSHLVEANKKFILLRFRAAAFVWRWSYGYKPIAKIANLSIEAGLQHDF